MKHLLLLFLSAALVFSCQQDEPTTPEDFGYLTIGITVEVESEPASGRVAAVNTDNFKVIIFQADGTEYLVIDPFSSAPPEVQLPVGEYYVEATSNDLVEAAFDSPYYFARSDNFTIDKEELKTIDIEAKLANCKVAINFSSEVQNVFDAYSGQVEVVSSGTTLSYVQGETREGYFVVEPLAVEVYLSYTKLDGTTIDRTFNTSIDDPQPATLYNINVDATLEDGQIVFNLTVDESVDTVDIDLGDLPVSSIDGCRMTEFSIVEGADVESWLISYDVDGLIDSIEIVDNDSDAHWTLEYNGIGQLIRANGYGETVRREDFIYDDNGNLSIRERYYDFGSGLEHSNHAEYTYNAQNQLIHYQSFSVSGANMNVQDDYQFTYTDASNNPARLDKYDASGNLYEYNEFIYDDKINIIRESGLWVCDDCLDFEFLPFTDNNMDSMLKYLPDGTSDGFVLASFNYNSFGYPYNVSYFDGEDVFEHDFVLECQEP
ncbi:DUF4493 domain-containing protein [Marinoscillum sp.]|uniref:DUF4493 domain-containing protein n=1 Tax=Marinoscillum sp. TaxID=2024838 RepID=UPI003BABB88F